MRAPLLLVAALASAALLAGAAPATGSAAGTATVIAEFEPPCLNVLHTSCNLAWTAWTAGVAIPGAFRITPSLSFEPMLVDHVDVETSPFALTYHLRDEAVWSDGTEVSADDLLFTQAVITNPNNQITVREGHNLVVEATKLGPKTARFVFSEPYARWKSLFYAILPRHVLEGTDFDDVWQTEITDPATDAPIGSGPFLVTGRTPGQSLTLTRNPLWWGRHAPWLDSITVKFVPDINAQVQAMIAGTGDVLAPQPQLQIADLRALPQLVVQTESGRSLEHLDFNVAATTMPLLDEPWFRQAVAHALDRDPLYPLLYDDISPDLGTLQNLFYPQGHADYRPSFARYGYSAAAVTALMQSHGCVLGGDNIWSCDGVRASVKFATTTGNQLRLLAQQHLIDGAAAAGIELVPDNSAPSELFVTRLPQGLYELMMFTWVSSSTPQGMLDLYGCNGTRNDLGYCSATATALLTTLDAEVAPSAWPALVNDANDVIADDAPTIPLFFRPSFLVSRATLQGPRINVSEAGPTWNTEDWFHGTFADVPPSNPFYSYIEDLYTAGITTGCGTSSVGRRIYCPGDSVPRQQMAAFLVRAKGLTQLFPATPSFVDVPASNPFFGYIERLKEQGITTGCNPPANDRFCPADFVPRQQMAAFLIRAKGLTQLNPATPSFVDVPASNPFYGYIERLKEQGITTGCNPPANNLYCPLDLVPRQQMAAFLMRAFP